ncbi:GGDEF domain-containing protein [Neobacillus niacini]|uniref:GGDEF domain-containing protein n=1 Tax=Neobacillus niacini TaxID=86668 RepID=UPI0021CB464F|nr:GGDEF domain-containing protein [Neobacillus niacini]MCM3767621.1 GGDEF domain-containing protein [Neobacillus niacini]
MVAYVGDIVEQVPCVSLNELNSTVDKLFNENTRIQGVVVINNEVPVSLISKTFFYQKIGTQYGYHLYMGKSIELLVSKDSLMVDSFQSVTEVCKLAMEREEQNRYDYVIVTKENKYIGVVSIEKLLMKLVEVQVEFASFLNPLTRLPGNHSIEEKLKEIIRQEKFSILYFDLDHFKSYNDTYGFKKGDALLQSTAELLKRYYTNKGSFLGHIGGDDFIAVVDQHDILSDCESLIKDFEKTIQAFYSSSHLSQQYVIAENRQGIIEKIPLVSLSIAIVTNQNRTFKDVEELIEYAAAVKRMCKSERGSCYIINN